MHNEWVRPGVVRAEDSCDMGFPNVLFSSCLRVRRIQFLLPIIAADVEVVAVFILLCGIEFARDHEYVRHVAVCEGSGDSDEEE